MKIKDFLKYELSGWKKYEILGLLVSLVIIILSTVLLKDNIIAVISAICGILYTIMAGKGKISCYLFGLSGSGCYSYLSFQSALYGNLLLYLCYYIPMQILGIFRWKKHLNSSTNEIIKTCLSAKERKKLFIISIFGCLFTTIILFLLKDSNPIMDGITTFLSVIGMYLTVKRCIEQWIIWIFVNGLSAIMWLNLVLNGAKVYATVIMWCVYFVLAIYFYRCWYVDIKLQKEKRTK